MLELEALPIETEPVAQRKCQTLSAGTTAESECVPYCVALHLHRQMVLNRFCWFVLLGFFHP